MIDLIVFSVGSNRYSLDIENIQRIIQATELTNIPNVNPLIDGMLSYEDDVIKVLNFRKLIGIQRYAEELETLFLRLKDAHQAWIDELRHSVDTGSSFTRTLDPHKCELGVWLDSFNSYDSHVTLILKDLIEHHKNVHIQGASILNLDATQKDVAHAMLNKEIYDSFTHTMSDIDRFTTELEKVSNSLQKFIIYENKGETFAIKVDTIEDIAHIEEKDIINTTENNKNEFLSLKGVLDLKGVLINVIKTVKLPK